MMGLDEDFSNETEDKNDFNPFPDRWTYLNLQNKIDLLKSRKGYKDDLKEG